MSDGDENAGTAASAIGLAILTGLEKLWTLWRFINSTRDMLADHITSGSHTVSQISDLPHIDAAATANTLVKRNSTGQIFGTWLFSSGGINAAGTLYTDTDLAIGGTGSGFSSAGALYTPHGRANGVSGGLSAYIGADGRVAVAPSSRRFKKDIKKMSLDRQAVLAMQVVQYRYKVAIDPDSPTEVGVIAEDLDRLGLTWLVAYDESGAPFAVHYEKIALALLPVMQDHEERLGKLEAR